MKKIRIAIDGPAGAGKSTIAKHVSKTLGIIYLDTGAMYRTVALKAIQGGVGTLDREKLSKLVQNLDLKIEFLDGMQRIYLDGEDVSEKIRTPGVSKGASEVATIPEVRVAMVELQRAIARGKSVVMDGRDIGSHVLPDAEVKVFLTASLNERAKRRYLEQSGKDGGSSTLEDVKSGIEYRDKNDSGRDFAPLVKAGDAVEIDTTELTIEDAAEKIMLLVKRYQ